MAVIPRGETLQISQDPAEITPDLLIQPRVVAGLAYDIFSTNAERVGDFWLTSPVEVALDDSGQPETLVMGKKFVEPNTYPRVFPDNVLYIKGEDEDTLQPWVVFEDMGYKEVKDGAGEIIADPTTLQQIRDALMIMDKAYIERSQAKISSPNFEPREIFLEGIEKEIGSLAARLVELKSIRDTVSNGGALNVVTHIKSGWEDQGEKSPEKSYPVDDEKPELLPGIIEDAMEDFKVINHRSDVQGRMTIKVEAGDAAYPVSKDFWEVFFRQRQGTHSESMALGYAVSDATKEKERQSDLKSALENCRGLGD